MGFPSLVYTSRLDRRSLDRQLHGRADHRLRPSSASGSPRFRGEPARSRCPTCSAPASPAQLPGFVTSLLIIRVHVDHDGRPVQGRGNRDEDSPGLAASEALGRSAKTRRASVDTVYLIGLAIFSLDGRRLHADRRLSGGGVDRPVAERDDVHRRGDFGRARAHCRRGPGEGVAAGDRQCGADGPRWRRRPRKRPVTRLRSSPPVPASKGAAPFLPLTMAISFFVFWPFAGMASPASVVRIMACKDTRVLRQSIFLLAVYNMGIYLPLIMICICRQGTDAELGEAGRSDSADGPDAHRAACRWAPGFPG